MLHEAHRWLISGVLSSSHCDIGRGPVDLLRAVFVLGLSGSLESSCDSSIGFCLLVRSIGTASDSPGSGVVFVSFDRGRLYGFDMGSLSLRFMSVEKKIPTGIPGGYRTGISKVPGLHGMGVLAGGPRRRGQRKAGVGPKNKITVSGIQRKKISAEKLGQKTGDNNGITYPLCPAGRSPLVVWKSKRVKTNCLSTMTVRATLRGTGRLSEVKTKLFIFRID